MKKLLIVLIVTLISSCASHPGRVCGGSRGKRCVYYFPKNEIIISSKSNS
ncbi:hypothetical protein OX283_000720 [Flavobacterium sp. SUN052]|nr:hypothetical protein [Flavobacterium sp. SUN052]MEC4003163.1 hypothetical protein [Flavobacterium sp. SUN052]